MTNTTQVLECDPASISFPGSSSIPAISSASTLSALRLAAHHLVDLGNVIIFPTETVYGLGADALSPDAVRRIFATKGRPADNPLIVHVSSLDMLHTLIPTGFVLPAMYQKLIEAFWPGALTLLFPADMTRVPAVVTAGQATVAVRMPSQPVARALIALAGTPLAAPSANSSGKPSPTRMAHVLRDLGRGQVPLALDGGPCGIGVESTVVDGLANDGYLRVLRPGGVTVEAMERVLAEGGETSASRVLVHHRDFRDEQIEQAPTTPGMKYQHYAPSVPVVLLDTQVASRPSQPPTTSSASASKLRSALWAKYGGDSTHFKSGLLAPADSILAQSLRAVNSDAELQFFPLGSRSDPGTSAARLFDGLLTLERDGADIILIEIIPEEYEGLAFMNRVRKAARETWAIDDAGQNTSS